MGYAKPLRDSNGDPVKNAFEKQSTAGDIFRIDVREPGKLFAVVPTTSPFTIILPFNYQVGQNQLVVHQEATSGRCRRLFPKSMWDALGLSVGDYYEEIDNTSLIVYGSSGEPTVCTIPHTSTPGAFSAKVVVKRQGDNIGIKLEGEGDGIQLTSPNSKKWLIRVDDEGGLARQEVT